MKSKHTIIRNENLFCTHCGGEKVLVYPISISDMTKEIETFNEVHGSCKLRWGQPFPDKSLSVRAKEDFWLKHGEHGSSSMTIFENLAQRAMPKYHQNHPLDPDDFRRCYLLLNTIPEWKTRLPELKTLSPVWSKLVDNWDKLTEMLEEQMKTGKANGMYEFMQSLGC
jgi:hypothetical protein